MDNLIYTFIEYLKKDKRLSKSTVQSYRRDIEQYLTFIKSEFKQDLKTANKVSINAFIDNQKSKGKATSTISRNIVSLKKFYTYLNNNGVISLNPAEKIASPKIEKKVPQILSKSEVEKLISQPDCNNSKGYRDKAMLKIMYSSGVRVSELIDLNISNVDLDNNTIKCLNNKKERKIILEQEVVDLLKGYLFSTRATLVNNSDENALFVNLSGKRLTRQGFWKIMKKYKIEAKIEKDLTPHTLRHSIAAHMLESGKDLEYIKEVLGHSDISSTQVYMKIVNKNLSNLYKKNSIKF